jgi:hypothetical protein
MPLHTVTTETTIHIDQTEPQSAVVTTDYRNWGGVSLLSGAEHDIASPHRFRVTFAGNRQTRDMLAQLVAHLDAQLAPAEPVTESTPELVATH